MDALNVSALTPQHVAGVRRSVRLFQWVRRMHGWIGLWGAALGLLFGVTGFLLNHRAVMKIPAGHIAETQLQITLDAPPQSAEALANQLAQRFGYRPEQTKARSERARDVVWNGQTVRQPERWNVSLDAPNRFVRAEYYLGNRFVAVKQFDPNPFSLLSRLHMGASGSAGWILLADTLAGGLVFLTLSGLLLWSRLRTSRLVGGVLLLGGTVVTLWCALSAF